jgi:hypothetical protein
MCPDGGGGNQECAGEDQQQITALLSVFKRLNQYRGKETPPYLRLQSHQEELLKLISELCLISWRN